MIAKKQVKDKISKLFADLNTAIMKINQKSIGCDKYPIYVAYYNLITDVVFAVVYPKKEFIEIGLNLKKTDMVKGLKSAEHMKYSHITKSIILRKGQDLNQELKLLLKCSFMNA